MASTTSHQTPIRHGRHLASTETTTFQAQQGQVRSNDAETIRKRRDTANRIFNDLSALLTMAYKNGKDTVGRPGRRFRSLRKWTWPRTNT